MDGIIRICATCIITVFLAAVLRQYKEEYALLCILACSIGVFLLAVYSAVPVFGEVKNLFDKSGSTEYYTLLLKGLGICCITRFASSFCRDSGYGSLADKAELIGKTALLLTALPLIGGIVDFASSLVK